MRTTIIILVGLAIVAVAFVRDKKRTRPAWFQQLKGWQKLFGLIAVLLAVLILINPDFLALGLLGDTTFFDVLVLALSLQMLMFVRWLWRYLRTGFVRSMRRVGIPSPGFRYLLAVSAVAVGSTISTIHKVVHRIIA